MTDNKRRSFLKYVGTGATSAAAVSLAGCAGGFNQSSGPIKFGGALPLTGYLAPVGKAYERGYKLWRDHVNKKYGGIRVDKNTTRKVELKLYDDQTKPSRDTKLYSKLVSEDNVDFFLGPYTTGATLAAAPIADREQIPMVEAGGASSGIFKKGYKYTYQAIPPAKRWMPRAVKAAGKRDDINSIAFAHGHLQFPTRLYRGAKKAVKETDLEVVLDQEFQVGSKSLSSLITKIKNADPDMVLSTGYVPDSMKIIKEAKSYDVNVGLWAFGLGPEDLSFVENLGSAANYTVGQTYWWPTLDFKGPVFGSASDYATLYKDEHDTRKDLVYSASASAVGAIFQIAIENAGTADPKQVKKALDSMNAQTFHGRKEFADSPHGLNISTKSYYVQVQDGKRKLVWPSDVSTTDLQYPTPPWSDR